jgi:hypothetical protein
MQIQPRSKFAILSINRATGRSNAISDFQDLLLPGNGSLLEDMNKKCRQNEIICEYIEQLRALGQESIRTGEKVTTIFGVHQMTINTIEIKRCRKPPPDLNKEIVE